MSISLLLLFAGFVVVNTAGFYTSIEHASLWVRKWFGHFYLYLGLFCVLFILILALSPFGKQKLGNATDVPEFSRWAWIAMLYSAGMGAGILLRAVQEPVFMQQNPPIQTGASSNIIALEYTFYQWGFTAWAFYGLFALIIGYYLFTKKRSALISASIQSITTHQLPKHSIDILATITTVFGLVGAVGLGTTQINGGLNHITQGDFGLWTTIGITLCIAILAFFSVWKGMHKGIKRISTLNIWITLAILLYVFVQSDMVAVVSAFAKAVTHYIKDFIPLSLAIGSYDPGEAFLTDWTYYYWAFWLAWAPFTGIFIARISRGRTIRELLLGVLIIPAMGTFFWFSVFGDSAFTIIENWGTYTNEFGDVFSSIFVFFENYPFASVLNVITMILLVSFLVTSVDSAVFVLSMFTDHGNPTPKRRHRLIWSIGIAVFAIAMILLGNARPEINVLVALQKLLIITSLPFALFMVVMVIVFVRDIVKKKHT
ncbi:BCCT family transporter [uncultured Dokdonia sp.]|uniref:BCCT family transporter n=1 Tax=uncultured Dokdonia sp. TaxID=575653 RepID=UPI0034509A53